MANNNQIDIQLLDELIVGRVEPNIYAFTTETIPNYLKVGDTYRPIQTRLNEWRKYFPNLQKQFQNVAKVDEETFFRDFAIHKYLENDLHKTRLLPDTFKTMPYYSKEFFKDTTPNNLDEAILDIKNSYKQNNAKYQFYKFEESHIPIVHIYKREEKYEPRPNQQETINRFKEAINKGRSNLLMYAVMRFGKSFTSMCCAVEMDATIVLIVSAKADVKEEWKKTVESHIKFDGFSFLDSNSLLQSDSVIKERINAKEKVAIFLTLQDLQGDMIKTKHKEVFGNQIDLLLIDETHFGARAAEYGKVLKELKTEKEKKSETKLNDVSLDDLDKMTKRINSKIRIHLSGTPYRILMNSEFTKDDIIAFYQFTNIAEDQKKWDEQNLIKDDVKEWDNPYYGFPQMIRFAFNPNKTSRQKMEELKKRGVTYAFSELLKPQSILKDKKSQLHKKFVYEKEILDLLKVIDGTEEDENLLSFLDYDKLKEGKMCRHIVCVLPYRASCDAFEELIKSNKFKNLSSYEIINISGVENGKLYKNTKSVKSKISECENEGKKTITLTVNRMLTGSTVPEWDTMLYLKDTASPQEYDQAIFRLQSQFIKIYREPNGDIVKYNMKPQTLLVDFNPNRMFQMQEQKSQIYNVNVEFNGNTKLEERIKKELQISPIVMINNKKIVEVKPTNILDAVRKYSRERSVLDEATSISIDISLLDIEAIKAVIEKQGGLKSRQGLEIEPSEGEGDDIDTGDKPNNAEKPDAEGKELKASKGDEEIDYKGKFAMYYARILFFSFLTDSEVKSLQEIIDTMKDDENNLRIATHLNLEIKILSLFQEHINPFVLSELDYKIYNINSLANDTTILPIERASNAMKKFSRLSESEIVTPEIITDKMINSLPEDFINESSLLLDIASKQGEFVYAVYKKFGKNVANNFYSIPTSKIAYEFTRKVYKLLELNIDNIEKNYTSYDLIGENEFIMKDKININRENMKFDVIIGNPPYQLSDGGHGRSASPVYHKFIEQAKKLNPRYLTMIIPARWYAGGKGLDDFRNAMLNDSRIIKLVDFENSSSVFPGVDIAGGVCYFLWDRDNEGLCEITNDYDGKKVTSKRALNEFDIFIRHSQAVPIIRKVKEIEKPLKFLNEVISPSKPFGLRGHYKPKQDGIPCYFTQKIGLEYADPADIKDNNNLLNKWKLLIPRAPIAGQTDFSKPVGFYYDGNVRIAKPSEVCTESWLVACAFNTKDEVLSFKSYLFTKIVRFLLLQTVVSQDVTREKFIFIPYLEKYDIEFTDDILRARWNITDEEWAFIDSKIKSIE